MNKMILWAVTLVLVLGSMATPAPEQEKTNAGEAAPDRATLEKQLADRLSNSRMVGFFMIEGQNGPPPYP